MLRPTLIDTKGWSWAIGTPKGRNWFFIEHTAAQSRDESTAWQAPTVGCRIENGELIRAPHPLENPFVEFNEIKNLWLTMPERTFRQEILAEFIEGEGAVFRNIPACMNAPKTTPAQHAGHRIVAGCDWQNNTITRHFHLAVWIASKKLTATASTRLIMCFRWNAYRRCVDNGNRPLSKLS